MFKAVLVIGIHREELAFGEKVADILKFSALDVIKIKHGLSSKKPIHDDLFYYTTRHSELYLQLCQQVKRKYNLLIDLHTGVNDTGRCADIFSKSISLLDGLQNTVQNITSKNSLQPRKIKLIQIIEDAIDLDRPIMEKVRKNVSKNEYDVCHTVIPQAVWSNKYFMYAGVELYLQKPGEGKEEDWRFAAEIIMNIHKCGEALKNSKPNTSP